MSDVYTMGLGARNVQADFRPVIGKRLNASGDLLPFTGPNGNALEVRGASSTDLNKAVVIARQSFGIWHDMAPMQRRTALLAFADAIFAAAPELATLDCLDMGKPIAAAKKEAHVAAHIVRWYAECIDKHGGFVAASHPATLSYSDAAPYGVVGAIISWNYPVINAAMKIGPALAAGNAVVLKPSEHSPLSALRLGDLAVDAGLPPGLLSVLHGDGILGEALCAHPSIDMLAFTGSTPTGVRVAQAAAQWLRPLILECGGKNPIVVAGDIASEVEPIVDDIVAEAFENMGQLCVARSRLIVPRTHRGVFVDALIAKMQEVKSADPADAATRYGPLAYQRHAQAVHSGVQAAVAAGARMLLDGRPLEPHTVHTNATLIEASSVTEPAMLHEYFGPVLTLYTYDTFEQALAAANSGTYGLAATAWTRDLLVARAFARGLRAGQITIKAEAGVDAGAQMALPVEPTGMSGYGIEFGIQALGSYSRRVAVQYLGCLANSRTSGVST